MSDTEVVLNDALSSNYLLSSVSIKSWSGKQTDRKVSDEVTQSKGATHDAGVFTTKLLASADKELRAVHAAAAQVRQYFYNNTLPWSVTGNERIVSTAKSMEFLRGLNEIKRVHDEAVLALSKVWDIRVQEATANLAGLSLTVAAGTYPPASELADRFGVVVELRPIPTVRDFSRLNVPATLAAALGQRADQQAQIQLEMAKRELRDRLTDSLDRLAKQLDKAGSGERTKLFETLLTNTRAVADMMRSMNFTGDERINEMAGRIEARLLRYPIETLREDKTKALEIAGEAKAIRAEADGVEWY
jgi:hypothetical protein